jgi:hypothetical protein
MDAMVVVLHLSLHVFDRSLKVQLDETELF